MDNVQNSDSYINIPSSQKYRSYFKGSTLRVLHAYIVDESLKYLDV
jgi:hypothetical protein